jgi:hypothetical protein
VAELAELVGEFRLVGDATSGTVHPISSAACRRTVIVQKKRPQRLSSSGAV